MTKHMTGTREEWLASRLKLLEEEKELTRQRDWLSRQRRELPWATSSTAHRAKRLADLFDGRSQLIVYHFMFHPVAFPMGFRLRQRF